MFIGQCPHWLPFYRLTLNAGSCPLKTFLLVSDKISILLSLGSPSFYQKLIKLFYFKQVVNQQTVLKNNAETSQLPFIQFPPRVTSCSSVVQHHSQQASFHTILWSYPDFICFTSRHLYVCSSMPCFITCIGSWICLRHQIQNSSVNSRVPLANLLLPHPSPVWPLCPFSNSWKPLILSFL